MGAIASQITSLATVFSTVYSDADQSKYQSSASLAIVRGIHWSPVNSPHKGPVTRKMFPFDDVIMLCSFRGYHCTVMSYGHHGVEITGNSTVCLFFCFYANSWLSIFISSPDFNPTPLAALLCFCRAQRGSDRTVLEIRRCTAISHIKCVCAGQLRQNVVGVP